MGSMDCKDVEDDESAADSLWFTKPDTVFSQLICHQRPEAESSTCMDTNGEEDDFTAHNVSPQLAGGVRAMGCERLFELQKIMLKKIRFSCSAGGFFGFQHGTECESDLCICSPTGTGKTLAYMLPVLDTLVNLNGAYMMGHPKILVLAPTKDLVDQIFAVCSTLTSKLGVSVVKIGSSNVSLKEEASSLVEQCPLSQSLHPTADIVVATPGRLAEHLKTTEGFSLKYLRFLIIDEADALFNMHPFDWLTQIETSIHCGDPAVPRIDPRNRKLKDLLRNDWVPMQKILVSATFPTSTEVLQPFQLHKPKLIVSENIFKSSQTMLSSGGNLMFIPSNISVKYIICEEMDKPLIFLYFLMELKLSRFLCFTKGCKTAEKLFSLFNLMSRDANVCFLSKAKPNQHASLLKKFSKGEINGVISNDVLARGIDLSFDSVLIYDHNSDPNTFVHRVGRCGRAGRNGTAVSIVTPYEIDSFLHMTSSQLGLNGGSGGGPRVENVSADDVKIAQMKPQYMASLKKLKTEARSRHFKRN